jgi:hypothetical protein
LPIRADRVRASADTVTEKVLRLRQGHCLNPFFEAGSGGQARG